MQMGRFGTILAAAVGLVAVAALAGAALRLGDSLRERSARSALLALQPAAPAVFDPAMVSDLPEPARRYFLAVIRPGTALRRVAEIEMTGTFDLGSKAAPRPLPMTARQTLAAPEGFVWTLRAGSFSGSDGMLAGRSWTRFRIAGLVPVLRRGGNADHLRATFGRVLAEAAFWTPAALLPGPGVVWEAAGPDTARVTVTAGPLVQSVDLAIGPDGLPVSVSLLRWTDANPEGTFRLQPFGGTLAGFRDFDGYLLPTQVEAGNHFGTDDWHPFFRAEVTAIRFPPPPG